MANVTVSPDTSEVILLVKGMAAGRDYPVRVSAVNAVGSGPPDTAILRLDPSDLLAYAGSGVSSSSSSSNYSDGEVLGYTWVIALLGSLAFVLILISGVMLYYR